MAEEMAERDVNSSEEQSISRRRAMEKLGRYGLYTAPAMLAVLDAAQAQVPAISGGGPVREP